MYVAPQFLQQLVQWQMAKLSSFPWTSNVIFLHEHAPVRVRFSSDMVEDLEKGRDLREEENGRRQDQHLPGLDVIEHDYR